MFDSTGLMERKLVNYGRLGISLKALFFLIVVYPFLVYFLVFGNKFLNSTSDPRGTMVIAQNIAENHSAMLRGAYASYFKLPDGKLRYQVRSGRDGLEPNFPVGTPLIISPFVRLANAFGYDALSSGGDRWGQRVADYAVVLLLLYVLFGLVCSAPTFSRFREEFPILLVAGSLVGPTMATGLWSINLEILLMAIAALLLRRREATGWQSGLFLVFRV